jgi:hypothetical protein
MRGSELPLALLPLVGAVLLGLALWQVPAGERWTAFVGESLPAFLVAMPQLALPFLVAALVSLRHGACTMPVLTSGIAGMLSGGFGAALYALSRVGRRAAPERGEARGKERQRQQGHAREAEQDALPSLVEGAQRYYESIDMDNATTPRPSSPTA